MFWNRRVVRIGVGLALLVLAVVVILPVLTGYTSLDGTVNARFIILSAPIEGTVQNTAPKAGTPITRGQQLVTIINERIDRSNLVELSAELTATRERLEALTRQQSQLTLLRDDLQQRLDAYQQAVIRNLDQEIAVQKERIGVAEATDAEKKSDLSRKEKLRVGGHISESELERLQHMEHGAQHEIEVARNELERLERELTAAGKGVFIGEARNDVPYSLQRMDEVTILLADIASKLKEQEGRRAKLEKQIEEETGRLNRLSSATTKIDFNSVMWRNNVVQGSNVIVGSELMRVLDCRDLFVDILVPEVNYDEVYPGLRAEVRLFGSDRILPGQVQSVRGSHADIEDKVLAAQLPRGEAQYARIRVLLSLSDLNTDFKNFCHVGRTVHVRLPRRSFSFTKWLQALWFSIS